MANTVKYLELHGKRMTFVELSNISGIAVGTIQGRLSRGWSVEDAALKHPRVRKHLIVDDKKLCSSCKKMKPLQSFNAHRSYLSQMCKECESVKRRCIASNLSKSRLERCKRCGVPATEVALAEGKHKPGKKIQIKSRMCVECRRQAAAARDKKKNEMLPIALVVRTRLGLKGVDLPEVKLLAEVKREQLLIKRELRSRRNGINK